MGLGLLVLRAGCARGCWVWMVLAISLGLSERGHAAWRYALRTDSVAIARARSIDSIAGLLGDSLTMGDSLSIRVDDSLVIWGGDSLAMADSVRGVGRDSVRKSRWNRFLDSLSPGYVALAAMVLPGVGQVVNRDYWKIPVFYGGMAGFSYLGYSYHQRYRALRNRAAEGDRVVLGGQAKDYRLRRDLAFSMAGLFYAMSVADAAIEHAQPIHSPVGAMVASMLFPGLGQVYNGSYWKLPVLYGLVGYFADQMLYNHQMYRRFSRAIVCQLDEDPLTIDEWEGKRSLEELTYFEDAHHRNRDWYAIGLGITYLLNIVDAYVDAHLFYWNVNENLSVRLTPGVEPNWHTPGQMAMAMRLDLTF